MDDPLELLVEPSFIVFHCSSYRQKTRAIPDPASLSFILIQHWRQENPETHPALSSHNFPRQGYGRKIGRIIDRCPGHVPEHILARRGVPPENIRAAIAVEISDTRNGPGQGYTGKIGHPANRRPVHVPDHILPCRCVPPKNVGLSVPLEINYPHHRTMVQNRAVITYGKDITPGTPPNALKEVPLR